MVAYGTLKTKSAFKTYARVAGLNADIANEISKQIEAYEKEVANAEDEDEKEAIELSDFVEEQYLPIIEKSEPYQGIIVSKSPAPCGFLIYDGDIESEIGVIRVNSKQKKTSVMCTAIDGYTADEFGYVKNDLLVVNVVSINSQAYKRAGIPQPSSSELIEMTKNDKAVWDVFANGWGQGINQCQKASTIEKLKQYKPNCLQDLSAFVAAIRPGFKSQVKDFIGRKHFKYNIAAIDDILSVNDSAHSSWMLYQENTMTLLNLAGISMVETYPIIKAISKKKVKVIEAAKDRFLDGISKYMVEHDNISEDKAHEAAEKMWQVIIDSSRYAFNACVSGDTMFYRCRSGKTVEEMYRDNDYNYVTYSMDKDHNVGFNNIVDIRYSGIRQLFEITTENGRTIKVTANHKFPTPSGIKYTSELSIGDYLYVATDRFGKASSEMIMKITPCGRDNTYDVEMQAPNHNFVVSTGIITCNSHSVAVSLDALYGAYLKAHYPFEYYLTLLDHYSGKGNKDKIAEIKAEMKAAYGITIAPPKYRDDNRHFSCNKKANTVSDALPSIKTITVGVANAMYERRNGFYPYFVDLLYDLRDDSRLNATKITTLIKANYFSEFGKNGKLLKLFDMFYEGKLAVKKTLIDKTQEQRLNALRDIEDELEDTELPIDEQIQFEIAHYGTPISVYPNQRMRYAITEVNDKYTPWVRAYSLATGKVGKLKIKKKLFNSSPLSVGSIMSIVKYHKDNAARFVDGKRVIIPNVFDIWIDSYTT